VGLITFRVKPIIAGQVRRNTRNGHAYSLHSQGPDRQLRVRGGIAMFVDLTPQVVGGGGSVVGNSARMKPR